MKKLICHCGAVEAEINLDGDLAKVIKCNCSICKRKGSITTIVDKKDLEIFKGAGKIKCYQFNTKAAKHFFCSVCGINTHNLRRSDPNTYGVNVGCLEDISTKELFELNVRVNDGKNHKMDRIEK